MPEKEVDRKENTGAKIAKQILKVNLAKISILAKRYYML